MKIRWLGHASFLIETGGKKIITDPLDERTGYPVFSGEADIAAVSHEHWDHSAVHVLQGSPRVIRGTGKFELDGIGIEIEGFASFHDKNQGQDRGENTIYKISAEGINLLHLGDLGHVLNKNQIEAIGRVDVLLLPVGGNYTIDAEDAFAVMHQLKPMITIPMHYKTPHCTINVAPVEAFVAKFDQVIKRPYLEINREELGVELSVVVLDYL